ncbi:multiple epidermal growth factor-like domains protein 6 isoform X2 [Haliotis rubra]|nr:multiple epidermal growth factor-like domains protein 6 isoform X2 [Haliotis rubra]XP_046546526.1 multiple epidermal growth factor-like domains protein 6 isoform X2 [Haliotis rubra]
MTIFVILWVVGFVTIGAVPCHHTQHCSDCDRETGDCLTECDTGYYDPQCNSTCSRNCVNNTCMLSEHASDNCTEGCVPGYSGIGCHIPCDSPGGNCTACPGGCDGGYCQLGSSCVSGCVDSYYGTDCDTGEDVGILVGLSASLATASVLVIVIVVVAVFWCCRPLRRDRFQLYVTPTQDMHAPTENIDAPQYAVVDEAGMYDVPSCQGKPAYPSRSDYELGTAFKHTTCPSPC